MPASLKPRRIPKYRLNRTTGRAVVTLNGVDHWLGKHGAPESREKYDRLIAEWLANGRTVPDARPQESLKLVVLIDRFWTHCQAFYRRADGEPTGEADCYRQALRPLKALYGSTDAAAFGPKRLKAVREKIIQMGWCRKFINKQISRLKSVFAWGVSEELIPADVHESLLRVKGLRRGKTDARESKPVRPVPEPWLEAVRPHLSSVVEAMMDLQLVTGMRPGEVCIMRRADIDTTGKTWVYRPQFHKTEHHGHTRDVWLGPKAQELVTPWLKPDLEAYLFSPQDAEAERYAHCKTHRRPNQRANEAKTDRTISDRYDVAAYRRAIARACDDAFPPPVELARQRVPGRKGKNGTRLETVTEWRARLGKEKWAELRQWQRSHRWHPHRLRHNAGTQLRKEFGLETARIILGHKSAAITEVYAEADRDKARQIMAQVG